MERPRTFGSGALQVSRDNGSMEKLENLREALIKADYTVDGVLEVLGPLAYAALARSESVPALRATAGGSPVETLIRLFLLQQAVDHFRHYRT